VFNITFRVFIAQGNTDDAFNLSANYQTTPLSVVYERCIARDCYGGWGTVRAFGQKFALEGAIGSHAFASL
jgi:hypothetical protein